jgi:SAM-dependent methyltransferase
MKEWDKDSIKRFHEEYEGRYAGDTLSSEIVRLSKKFIGNTILDVGAGSGALMELIPESTGIDLVSKHPRMITGDVTDTPFKQGSFETIFATDILEHLDDKMLDSSLKEVHRLLKNNGTFVITVPYKEDLKQNVVICPDCGIKFHKVGHTQVFDEERIKTLLLGKGFKIEKLDVLPLSFMANHKFLKHFKVLFKKFGFINQFNMFIVAVKK